jgi:hypothetical protein
MLEPNTDDVLARDLDAHHAPADRDEMEFLRWLVGLGDETQAVLHTLEEDGGADIWAAFWVAREAGRL